MTNPYMTGTVTVTAGSAVVTGSGTAWQTALVTGGLFGLDSSNGNPVPILSVDSDTQLTLAKPWRGTSAAGQAYWIIRDTAYLQQMVTNAQALATYIQRLDNASLSALASLVPAADRLPFFNGSGTATLATLTGFARSLLDDANAATMRATLELSDNNIAALSLGSFGVYSPSGTDCNTLGAGSRGLYGTSGGSNFPPTPGGFWFIECQRLYSGSAARQIATLYSSSGAADPLVYVRIRANDGTWGAWRAVSDTLSSNANGIAVRLSSGLQICCTDVTYTLTTAAYGSIHRMIDALSWTFPAAFSVRPQVLFATLGSANLWATCSAASASSASATVFAGVPFSGASTTMMCAAIGRWF